MSFQAPTRRSRIVAVANQKGGVGKTTTALNLATALAAVDQRVLLIDLDPQGNASTGLGIPYHDRKPGSYQLLIGSVALPEATKQTVVPRFFIVPAGVDLSGAEIELVGQSGRERYLSKALDDHHASFDYVIIDCPPALGLLTINALVAADSVLVPLQCEFFALEGISHLVKTVERVRRSYNAKLKIQGIVLTMFDRRNRLSDLIATDVRSHFGPTVYETMIPRNVRISEAASHGRPAVVFDLNCAGSQAYIQLASEVLKQDGITVSQ